MSDHDRAREVWRPDLLALADSLREMGYDIESPPPDEAPIGSVIARRDLEDRAVIVAIDAGGRFRAAITWVVGEWPSQAEIAGVPVQAVDAVSRAVTVTGQAAAPEQLLAVVAGLGTIAPWASMSAPERPPGDDAADHSR